MDVVFGLTWPTLSLPVAAVAAAGTAVVATGLVMAAVVARVATAEAVRAVTEEAAMVVKVAVVTVARVMAATAAVDRAVTAAVVAKVDMGVAKAAMVVAVTAVAKVAKEVVGTEENRAVAKAATAANTRLDPIQFQRSTPFPDQIVFSSLDSCHQAASYNQHRLIFFKKKPIWAFFAIASRSPRPVSGDLVYPSIGC